MKIYENWFPLWISQLAAGTSILLYGWGSKQRLLHIFEQVLSDLGTPLLTVLGFKPTVTACKIILKAAEDVLKRPRKTLEGLPLSDILRCICSSRVPLHKPLYIVLHNIDGPGLRTVEEQDMLARLLMSPHIRLVASFDHVDTPMLWDQSLTFRFHWVYYHVPTYESYIDELRYMESPLQKSGTTTDLPGDIQVLKQLSATSRQTFRIIIETLAETNYKYGITFGLLLRKCREKWIISSAQGLRTLLRELFYYGVLRNKRGKNGETLIFCRERKERLNMFFRMHAEL